MPFPRRKKVKNLEREKEFKKFMKVLNKLEMAIPLVEALEQMPSYAKFLKELLTKKRKPLDDEMVSMTEECSALIQRKLPQKKKDPGSFTIPCSIGDLTIGKALCDLGASVNLMPLSMMKKIPGAVAKPTKMSLSLADRSIVHPEGILHDVLVKVAGFVFPADFVVLVIEETREWEPLLLGRPFLATSRALIDVEMGELMLRTDDQQVTFNVFDKMECGDGDPQCFKIQVYDHIVKHALNSSSRMRCLSCVIWSIWKQRNNCIWNNVADAQNFVVSRDIAMLNDWRVVHMVSVDAMEQHVGNDCIWKKPTNGRVKCNIDAGV
ncbi:unnamed protein product [Trifolium pratense]|uniref:Uncharacterized protein n=1 Tax=Trifolium pratense TaxID=57577 RepID=A0ACB0KWG6_TRIPR|nr:unnamed protein product [Trifolium pratense]